MKTYVLQSEQRLAHPIGEVFAFFADPRNLETLTPPWLRFRILTPANTEMKRGALIQYRLRLHGLPVGWLTEITAWEPPGRFVDEQRRGPYRLWRHEHTFEADPEGTVVRDRVEYSVPGGPLVHRLFVARDLERIFAFRRDRLARIFE